MTKRSLAGWLFVLPFLLGFLFFIASPMYTAFMMSIHSQGIVECTELTPEYELVDPASSTRSYYVRVVDGDKNPVLKNGEYQYVEEGGERKVVKEAEFYVLKLNNAGEKTYDANGNVLYEMENGKRKVVNSISTVNTLTYVGLENYKKIATTNLGFINSISSTLPKLVYIPAILIFSFMIANLLNAKFRGRTVARVIFFMPVVTASGVAAKIKDGSWEVARVGSSVSGALSNTDFDITTSIKNILSDMPFMTPFVDLITTAFDQLSNIVLMSGIQILIFLAALQTISPSLFEASDMEGASKWEAFWKITFPMVSPMILVATMYTMIDVLTGSSNPMISYLFGSVGSTSLSLSDRMTMGWLYFIGVALLIVIVSAIISRFVYNENDVTTKKKGRR
jgi:ABC transporter, permease protein